MVVLITEEQGKRGLTKYAEKSDGLQSVIVELQSAPIRADKMDNERRNKEAVQCNAWSVCTKATGAQRFITS